MGRSGGYRDSQLAAIRNSAENWFVRSRLKDLAGDSEQWKGAWIGLLKDPITGTASYSPL